MSRRPVLALVALGSNLGDRLRFLRAARDRIALLPRTRLLASSPVYETEPVHARSPRPSCAEPSRAEPETVQDPPYLNAVLLCRTRLPPDDWSRRLHAIEDELGRVRTGVRDAPRTIDIDLLTYGSLRVRLPHLTLPHPEATLRRFVLQPLADLCPGLVLPGQTLPVSALLAALPATPWVRPYASGANPIYGSPPKGVYFLSHRKEISP